MTFLELAEKVLLETQVPMRMAEIWEYAIQKEYDKELNSSGKTPWKTLDAQMYSSMKHDKNTPFIKTNTKPKKFYLKSVQSVETIIDKNELVIEQKELKNKLSREGSSSDSNILCLLSFKMLHQNNKSF